MNRTSDIYPVAISRKDHCLQIIISHLKPSAESSFPVSFQMTNLLGAAQQHQKQFRFLHRSYAMGLCFSWNYESSSNSWGRDAKSFATLSQFVGLLSFVSFFYFTHFPSVHPNLPPVEQYGRQNDGSGPLPYQVPVITENSESVVHGDDDDSAEAGEDAAVVRVSGSEFVRLSVDEQDHRK